ncbi:ribonuclease [Streptomyces sp. TLI_171]|uniref:ribonuclease n=1 Tax=Streptomyces sp. TLI_171 TaxID=1938859 RepID=UPI000C194434|nr:ribonuclease [Streptomyces sp. TLI_171]RKE18996.1 ribonuclease T1 [Streptomyces sp. TLI_171]
MSSRNRPISLAALVLLGLTALVGCGDGSGSPSAATSASAPASPAATRSGTASAPKPSAPAKSPTAGTTWVPVSGSLADVCRSKLPAQALDTLGLIAKGGPYPYRSDGIVFENRESRLPRQNNGYYHEFTVVTPGSDDRGTRRVVTGVAGEQYWTADHYASFQEIDPRC